MKITLYKYILNEIWPTFIACMLVFAFIALAIKILSVTDMVVARGIPLSQVIRMVIYLIPDIALFALPAVCLIAVVLAFLRLSVDSEIIALKSCGISLYQMLPPVIMFSLVGLLGAGVISFVGVPWGVRSFKGLIYEAAQSQVDTGIKERTFTEPIQGIMFYTVQYSKQKNEMEDVFFSDKRDKNASMTILAEKCRMVFHQGEKIITLRFENGTVFMVEKDLDSGRTVKFKTYDLNIELKDIFASRKIDPEEMSVPELISRINRASRQEKEYYEMMRELLEKVSVPLAAFLMGIIGAPLGAQLKSKGRSMGIGVSVVVFIGYYVTFVAAKNICDTGVLPPEIGVWIPDLLLMIAGIYFLRRIKNEKTIHFFPFGKGI